jgi:hypothetical protein
MRSLKMQIFEMVLPFCFVWIMVALRNSITDDDRSKSQNDTVPTRYVPEFIPNDYQALIPFSYYDYIVALQASRVCTTRRDRDLEISGLHDFGRNWQVPFVKCDSTKCLYLGQDAQPFCEYSFLAVASSSLDDVGGRTRAMLFQQWMYDRWPVLVPNDSNSGNSSSSFKRLPFHFEFVQLFDSAKAMDEYISRSDYGTTNVPKMSMGIVFDGNSTFDYTYTLRQNSTNLNVPQNSVEGNPVATTTPPTNRLFNNFARTDFETCGMGLSRPNLGAFDNSCTGLYVYNGIIATQRLVGDFILHQTGAVDAGYAVADGGVSFVQFPQKAFVATGFFATVEGKRFFVNLLTS